MLTYCVPLSPKSSPPTRLPPVGHHLFSGEDEPVLAQHSTKLMGIKGTEAVSAKTRHVESRARMWEPKDPHDHCLPALGVKTEAQGVWCLATWAPGRCSSKCSNGPSSQH